MRLIIEDCCSSSKIRKTLAKLVDRKNTLSLVSSAVLLKLAAEPGSYQK